MNKPFEIIRQTRRHMLNLIKDLTIDELNKVPAGFNNNIIWNLGHVIASQQGVCYRRAGLDLKIDDDFFAMYKPETKPERFITTDELENIKQLLFSTIDQLEEDYKTDMFANYVPWVTRYEVKIDSVNDALTFLPFHEGLHMGYIMALKRAIG